MKINNKRTDFSTILSKPQYTKYNFMFILFIKKSNQINGMTKAEKIKEIKTSLTKQPEVIC